MSFDVSRGPKGTPRSFFQLPSSFDPEQTHRIHLVWAVLALIALSFTIESIIEIALLPTNITRWLLEIGVVNLAALAGFALSRIGRARQAGLLFVAALWALMTYLAITENGVRSPTVDIAYLVIILVAGLVIDERAGIITGIVCALTLLMMSLAGIQGLLPEGVVHRTIMTTWEADVFYLAIVIGLQYLAIHSIREALDQARRELAERRRVEADLRRSEAERARSQMRAELHQLMAGHLENERLKIARDLHDGPVQDLIAASFTLQALIDDSRRQPNGDCYRPDLESVQTVLHEQIAGLRSFAGELRSPSLAKFGLSKAIRGHLESFNQKHPEIAVNFQPVQDDLGLPEETRQTLFRIYQEIMNNIVRHAHATQVSVQVGRNGHGVQLVVQDNGVGFAPPPEWMDLARHGHLGLVGMRERAETVGGHLEVVSQPGQGATVLVTLPMNN